LVSRIVPEMALVGTARKAAFVTRPDNLARSGDWPVFDLKFLSEFAASGVGTSNRRYPIHDVAHAPDAKP
jgi:hypothetical protein